MKRRPRDNVLQQHIFIIWVSIDSCLPSLLKHPWQQFPDPYCSVIVSGNIKHKVKVCGTSLQHNIIFIYYQYEIFQFIHWKDIKTIQNSQMVFLGGYSGSLTLTLWQCYHLTHYTQLPISSNYLPILHYFEDSVMYKPKIKLLMWHNTYT